MAIILQQTPVTGSTSQSTQAVNDGPVLTDFDPGPIMLLAIILVCVAMFKVLLVVFFYAFKFAIGIAVIFFALKFFIGF